jgi:hypothetical protein
MKHSKLLVSLTGTKTMVTVSSYDYNELQYVKNDFKTYSGITRIFDNKLKELRQMHFENGRLIKVILSNCTTCILPNPNSPRPPEPGDTYVNWCVVMPALCDYSGGGAGSPQDFPPAGGGGSEGYAQIIWDLDALMNLNPEQADWLSLNINRAFELKGYLQNDSEPTKNEIATEHLNGMMNNPAYLAFVINHVQSGDPNKIWWKDDNWLSNPNNINFDIDANNIDYSSLTYAERLLVYVYPFKAWQMSKNVEKAKTKAASKVAITNPHPGHSDKIDAFRHAYYQALNVETIDNLLILRSEAINVVNLFANAHESETPSQLTKEMEMDIWNNNVGLVYAENCPSDEEGIADGILQKLNAGELRYLFPLYHTDSYWFTGPDGTKKTAKNGIRSDTDKIPTNQ